MNKVKNVLNTKNLVYIAMGSVIIAICSWISIPISVPFTMQTFAIFFVLSLLGGKRGIISILVYLFLGMVGLPVFSGFKAGIGVLLGSTGGYIVGFVFIGLIYMLLVELLGKKMWVEILAMVIGIAVLYCFGTAWFIVVYTRTSGSMGILAALGMCVFPFIIPDLIKMFLAILLSKRLRPLLKIER